jgi:hypothetical protein
MPAIHKRTMSLKLAIGAVVASLAVCLVLAGYEKYQDAADRAH